MKDRIYRLGREALWVLGGQIGVAVGSIIGIKILTQLLVPYEFGRLSVANMLVQLVGISCFGPLGQGLMRYWSISQDRNQLSEYVYNSRRYIFFLGVIVIVASLITGLTARYFQFAGWSVLIALAMVSGVFTGWGEIRLSILRAARQRKNVSLINITTAFAKPVSAAALIALVAKDAEYAIIGFLICAVVSGSYTEYAYGKVVKKSFRAITTQKQSAAQHHLGKEILAFSYPFFFWGIFAWVHHSCDRWALLSFRGADVVGAYSVMVQLATYPLIFGSSFLSTFFLPIAYQRAGELRSLNSITIANKILLTMTAMFLAGGILQIVLFSFFHSRIVLIVSNQEYVNFSYLLPALTGAWALYYLGQLLSSFGFLANKPRLYLKPVLFAAALAAVLSFSLAPVYGPIGVVWGLGVVGLLYATWCFFITKQLITHNR